jgi:hypothetical protein
VANRKNGRSGGPRPAAGKADSTRNSIRHGIFAHICVLPALGETEDGWDAFRDAIMVALAPVDEAELTLTVWYVALAWRASRCVKFELAAASVALEPAAILRDAQSPDATPDEPVDQPLAECVWAAACAACAVPPGPAEQNLVHRFWVGPGGRRTGSTPGWECRGWSVATLRAVLAFLACGVGKPPDRVAVEVREELAKVARYHAEKAAAVEARAGRVVRARRAAQVEDAMNAVGRGPSVNMLELGLRYEKHLGTQMECVLRQLAMLRALRVAMSR